MVVSVLSTMVALLVNGKMGLSMQCLMHIEQFGKLLEF